MPFSFLAGSNGFLMCNICLIKLTDASLTIAKEEKRGKQTQRKGRKYKAQMKDSASITTIHPVSQADGAHFGWIRQTDELVHSR